jgi:hypothetical protein
MYTLWCKVKAIFYFFRVTHFLKRYGDGLFMFLRSEPVTSFTLPASLQPEENEVFAELKQRILTRYFQGIEQNGTVIMVNKTTDGMEFILSSPEKLQQWAEGSPIVFEVKEAIRSGDDLIDFTANGPPLDEVDRLYREAEATKLKTLATKHGYEAVEFSGQDSRWGVELRKRPS